MKKIGKGLVVVFSVLALLIWAVYSPSCSIAAKSAKGNKSDKVTEAADELGKPNGSVDIKKMSNMTGFDPADFVHPKGDVIKIAYVNSFSGPGALNGIAHITPILFAAHDINQRGGIWVDGKKKLVDVIAADHQSRPDICKKICERMVLQEKVHVLMGTSGSNMMKIINEVANRYKVISVNEGALAEELQDATNFSRYAFMTTPTTEQVGRAMAYYYGQIRKKEKKFYILCQDYSFGRGLANGFKKGLKEYYPEAEIVGEDYHKLFLTDFAPYLTKIKASNAEVIYTGDWIPDASNLLKQARNMGVTIPFANLFLDEPNMLHEVGIEGTKSLVHVDLYDMPNAFKNHPDYVKFYKAWNNQWKKWKTAPYNSRLFEHGTGGIGLYGQSAYWLFSVIERAKSVDPEKIIKVWEGDVFQFANGKVAKMRACDHKPIQSLSVTEYVPPAEQKVSMTIPPYYWFSETCTTGPSWMIPASKILPPMDRNLDSCKGKNEWGE